MRSPPDEGIGVAGQGVVDIKSGQSHVMLVTAVVHDRRQNVMNHLSVGRTCEEKVKISFGNS